MTWGTFRAYFLIGVDQSSVAAVLYCQIACHHQSCCPHTAVFDFDSQAANLVCCCKELQPDMLKFTWSAPQLCLPPDSTISVVSGLSLKDFLCDLCSDIVWSKISPKHKSNPAVIVLVLSITVSARGYQAHTSIRTPSSSWFSFSVKWKPSLNHILFLFTLASLSFLGVQCHNEYSLLACVSICPILRIVCRWVVVVSPSLCFIYAWAGCLFTYTNKLYYNVSLGICSSFAFSLGHIVLSLFTGIVSCLHCLY